MLSKIALLVFLYVGWRLLWPLPIKRPLKLLLTALLMIVAGRHLLVRFFGGLASPEMPELVLIGLGWLYGALAFLFLFVLLKDAASLGAWLAARLGRPVKWPFSKTQAAAWLTAGALLISGYCTWQGLKEPRLRETEVVLPGLPQELDGLTLIQISDLHISVMFPETRTRMIVNRVNALKPDLILLTGDLIDGPVEKRGDDVAPLADLRARYGIWACVGNHEYYSGLEDWLRHFEKLGLKALYNQHETIYIHNQPLVLAGLADYVARWGRLSELYPPPDVKAAFRGAPEKALRVLMAHQPREAEINAKAGADLQLSGHTHGGQLIILKAAAALKNNGFLQGWHQVGGMKLYVSPGAALWNGFPLRLWVPSEITKIVLRAETSPQTAF